MFNPFKKQNNQPKNLEELLARFRSLEDGLKKLSDETKRLKEKNRLNIQKVGMVRFNPFKETGSDLSFSAALLDDNDSGVVITSLYTRQDNRIYGKPIKNGESEYQLSDEEKLAIEKAKNNNGKSI
ncbi:MAG: DUF4446 family protein [bacterium]